MRIETDAGFGYGTRFSIPGALVFESGESVTVIADPDFAGATIHRAHLRRTVSARTRGTVRAQTRRANRDR